MLLVHILLALLSLGLATQARTEKIIIASALGFTGACVSGVLLQTTKGSLSLHGISMLTLFCIVYGILLRASLRKRTKQTS